MTTDYKQVHRDVMLGNVRRWVIAARASSIHEAEIYRLVSDVYGETPEQVAVAEVMSEPAWPAGCIKPGSCSKATSRRCMYAASRQQCPHFGREIGGEIDAERGRRDGPRPFIVTQDGTRLEHGTGNPIARAEGLRAVGDALGVEAKS